MGVSLYRKKKKIECLHNVVRKSLICINPQETNSTNKSKQMFLNQKLSKEIEGNMVAVRFFKSAGRDT